MKAFAPPFFNHFSLSLDRKKTRVYKSHEKEATEAVVRRYSSKYVFLKNLQISHENTCVGVFFKKRLQHRCFDVKFAIHLRTSSFTGHL